MNQQNRQMIKIERAEWDTGVRQDGKISRKLFGF